MANARKDMQLNVGEMLQLVFAADDQQRKHATKVIGYLPGKSLIVTTPRIDGNLMLVREGQPVVVRILSGNSVYAFNTQVLATCLKPFAYIHLTYPAEIESIVVRKSLRVSTELETSVTRVAVEDPKGNVTAQGMIIDISTSGAMLLADTPLGQAGDLLTMTLRIPVAGVLKYLKISSMIRTVRVNNDGKYLHGVEFQLLEEMDNILLHGFVYEQLQKRV